MGLAPPFVAAFEQVTCHDAAAAAPRPFQRVSTERGGAFVSRAATLFSELTSGRLGKKGRRVKNFGTGKSAGSTPANREKRTGVAERGSRAESDGEATA